MIVDLTSHSRIVTLGDCGNFFYLELGTTPAICGEGPRGTLDLAQAVMIIEKDKYTYYVLNEKNE